MHTATSAEAQSTESVYAICSVRDVAVAGEDRVVGKIYRSAIFSVPSNFDADISLTPERGSDVSRGFERWVHDTHRLRADRVAISDGDEHYCVEAPATEEGAQTLVRLIREWSTNPHSQVEQVLTAWYPEGFGKRIAHLVPPSTAEVEAYRAALKKRQSDIAAMEEAHSRATAEARRVQEKFERERQAYREEYRRVTGRYPDN